jgi:hypothetical protein
MANKLTGRERYYCHPALTSLLLATVLTALLVGCGQRPTNASQAAKHSTPAATVTTSTPGTTYVDPKLGFHITLPIGWQAISYPGRHQPTGNTLISLREPTSTPATITIGVFHGANMPAAFAVRGTPPLHIGVYPAFAADTGLSQGKVPCVVRILLASEDYLLAEWCSMDATSHADEFERILATFQPASVDHRPPENIAAPAAQSCTNIQAGYGYNAASWGRILATPNANEPSGGWAGLAGSYICSNTGSPDRYLFQCTELVNRYDAEQWGLPHIPGNAARYFDYYQNGVRHPGDVRDLPIGSYAYSDDARQGTSAFAPQPGDLLVFQDVVNPVQGWTSGLVASPGHIALITAVDATHVYIAQENYNDRQYFLALTLAHSARGYSISDRSGVAGRIIRGWIRFTAENT